MNNTKLKINRVVIKKSGSTVYNQIFHSGINVIRGKNSTGKSTIIELISYGLGADIKKQHWKKEALLCDEIFIDLSLNNNRFVFKRPIEGDGNKPPIHIKTGNYENSIKSLDGWNIYGYLRTTKKVSFANRIFDLLGYEQHKTSDNDSLTIHQLFRLLYADQDTPASNIFRWESMNYDKESMRTAIGEFLFGFDDLEAHGLRQQLIIANKDFDKLDNELRAVYRILGKTNIKATTKELYSEIDGLNKDLARLDIEQAKLRNESIRSSSVVLTNEANLLSEKIDSLSHTLSGLEQEAVSISYDIEENQAFLKTLEFRKLSIKNAQATVNSLGMVEFEYCPSCLSKIQPTENINKHCYLCKEQVDDSIINESYLQAMEQIDFQFKETSDLIQAHKARKTLLIATINSSLDETNKAKAKFREINTYTDDYELELTNLASEKGFIGSQVQSLKDKLELASELDAKIKEKVGLQTTITILDDQLAKLEATKTKRKRKVLSEISSLVIKILSKDTGSEDSFRSAGKFEFDFGQNIILLDQRANFSASSNVLLKNAFHLAVLLAACKDECFRVPCFAMFDNIEDKGMTEDRSKNFQKIIVELCSELDTEYQLIMTTSMVDDALNNETLGVGPYYATGEHTLAI